MIDAIRIFEDSVREHLAPVLEFLDDPEISEIMINGPNDVYIEKGGKLHRTSARFAGDYELEAAIRNAAQFVGRTVDAEHPILEGRLPDGSRFQALIPPAAPDGAQVAIRKFSKDKLTMERLVEFGAMPTDAAEALRALVVAKRNIMVAGGTGSGKTSLLNALSSYIPTDERVVVIEEAKEVQLQQEHVVQLEARPPDASGKGEIRVRDLFRATLRMRPDLIIIGEIRGGEAIDILQAMTSGHGGCMGTLHASHPKDTLARLETMCMMSDLDLPLAAMKQQIGSGLDLVVQEVHLSAAIHLSQDRLAYDRLIILAHGGSDRQSIFRRRVDGAHVADPGQREVQSARNRSSG